MREETYESESIRHFQKLALHICGMILLVLWDGHLARPLYFRALVSPTLQESSLDSGTPKN
ncbi:hypothetical protein [Nostoc sp. DedQUE09]|uniref:hypothetical protein n=1 Tax=Nostoc sp. DedQUE09 TaxID=3075394 RepID=UPI002AD2026E|nr:hypothetical protein [Nostoc sp. DedQUE09]MDZ7951506.1 hypothetical protein [Nostoc sp. DedQUE09]